MHAFQELVTELKDDGIQLVLANPCANVKEHLSRVNLLEAVGKEWIFVRTADAVDVCSRCLLENSAGLKDDFGGNVAEGLENSQVSADSTLTGNWPGTSRGS